MIVAAAETAGGGHGEVHSPGAEQALCVTAVTTALRTTSGPTGDTAVTTALCTTCGPTGNTAVPTALCTTCGPTGDTAVPTALCTTSGPRGDTAVPTALCTTSGSTGDTAVPTAYSRHCLYDFMSYSMFAIFFGFFVIFCFCFNVQVLGFLILYNPTEWNLLFYVGEIASFGIEARPIKNNVSNYILSSTLL